MGSTCLSAPQHIYMKFYNKLSCHREGYRSRETLNYTQINNTINTKAVWEVILGKSHLKETLNTIAAGASGSAMVCKLDYQTFTSEFESLGCPIHMALCYIKEKSLVNYSGITGGVMVCKLDYETFKSEFESHWLLYSYGLVPRLSKKLNHERPLLLLKVTSISL